MKLTDKDKLLIQKYGPKYLSQNDIQTFLNMVYSHTGDAKLDVYSHIKDWLVTCDVEVPSFFQPTFICDGQDGNICPGLANKYIKFVGNEIIDYTFFACDNIHNMDIPDMIKDIGASAFELCSNLKSVKLPTSLSSISVDCFNYCQNLESIVMPSHVIHIGDSAFYYCSKLKTLDNLEFVTEIEGWAFKGCTELDNIKLGNVNLGEECFVDCKNLKTLEIGSLENKISSELSLFDGCDSLTEIKTRDAKLKAYLNKYYPNIRVAK